MLPIWTPFWLHLSLHLFIYLFIFLVKADGPGQQCWCALANSLVQQEWSCTAKQKGWRPNIYTPWTENWSSPITGLTKYLKSLLNEDKFSVSFTRGNIHTWKHQLFIFSETAFSELPILQMVFLCFLHKESLETLKFTPRKMIVFCYYLFCSYAMVPSPNRYNF